MSTYFSTESTNAEEVARALRTNNKDEEVVILMNVEFPKASTFLANISPFTYVSIKTLAL